MSSGIDRIHTLALIMSGMVPITFMERCQARCNDPHHPMRHELAPIRDECSALADVLMMADSLVAGGDSKRDHKNRAKALAALAKAIVILALAPKGLTLFGKRWKYESLPSGNGEEVRLVETYDAHT